MSDTPKPPTTLNLTRGAAYLLEAILQDPRPCDTPIKVMKWAKLYSFIRKSNDRTLTLGDKKYDLEKARNAIVMSFPPLPAGDPGAAAQERKIQEALLALEDVGEAWRNETVTLEFSKRNLDTAKAAIEYRIKNQDASKQLGLPINDHMLNLMVELGLDSEE